MHHAEVVPRARHARRWAPERQTASGTGARSTGAAKSLAPARYWPVMKIMWAAVTRTAQSILNWPSVADREDRAEHLELAERGGPGGARGAQATAVQLSKHQMKRTAAMVPVAVRRSTSCSGGVNGEGGVPCPGG